METFSLALILLFLGTWGPARARWLYALGATGRLDAWTDWGTPPGPFPRYHYYNNVPPTPIPSFDYSSEKMPASSPFLLAPRRPIWT